MKPFDQSVYRNADGGGGGGGGGAPAPSSTPSGGGTPPASTPSSSTPSGSPSGADPSPAPTSPGGSPPASPGGDAPPDITPHDNSLGDGLFEFPSDVNESSGDDDDVAPPSPTPPAKAPAEPTEPKTPPGVEPAAQPTPPAAEPTPPAAPASTGPQDQSPQSYPTEPAAIAQALAQNQDALIDHLAQSEFALSKEDLEALEADAPAHIPKLLARGYFKAQVNLMQQIAKIVPQMIQKQITVLENNRKNEDKFYGRWPELDRVNHAAHVRKYATVYRQANPQASLDQMIEDLGPIVMMAAKVQPKAAGAPRGNGTAGNPPPATPFVPALGGPAAPPQQIEENPWSGMAEPSQDED